MDQPSRKADSLHPYRVLSKPPSKKVDYLLFICLAMYKRNGELRKGERLPEGISRYALAVEYGGAELKGFQKQSSAVNTVQAYLEGALSRIASEPINLVCSGRTDAGVHATGQIIHFDTLAVRPLKAWVKGVNTHLPENIRVRWAKEVSGSFHARFSAISRTYRYIMLCDNIPSAIIPKQVTRVSYSLSIETMVSAAEYLIGEHDFSSFRAAQCSANRAVRKLTQLHFWKSRQFIVMEVTANAFLYHMVRNIAGAMLEVGSGRKDPLWVKKLLELKDRKQAPATAPADGLYLVDVEYSDEFELPRRTLGPLFL